MSGRVANERRGHVQRHVLPAAARLLFDKAREDFLSQPLNAVATINMGQSPPGNSCNKDGAGTPLLGGPSDLGSRLPSATRWTTEPKKLCHSGDVLVLCAQQ